MLVTLNSRHKNGIVYDTKTLVMMSVACVTVFGMKYVTLSIT